METNLTCLYICVLKAGCDTFCPVHFTESGNQLSPAGGVKYSVCGTFRFAKQDEKFKGLFLLRIMMLSSKHSRTATVFLSFLCMFLSLCRALQLLL